MRPDGRWTEITERTIQRKLAAYETKGLAGLGRSKRSDAGQRKTILTRAWDMAVKLPDETKEGIATKAKQRIRNLWANGAARSDVTLLASSYLADLTRDAGFNPGEQQLKELCRLPDNLIEAERRFRKVHVFETNAKAFHDGRRRIKRHGDGLEPMQIVFGDVHHMDVLVRRPDGSVATPKAIAWLDVATNRGRMDWILVEKGGGIRNSDVIASFIRMTQDPHWGLPKHIYVDNGSEYNWAEFIGDALKLSRDLVDYFNPRNPIIRALPYNAAAKTIEGFFGNIERTVFASLPGHIGGDRMNKKTANVGREPVPFDGSFEKFCDDAYGLIEYHNAKPQHGRLKGISPNTAFRRAVTEQGWKRTTIDPNELMMAFSVAETRRVVKGVISVGGIEYTCDELVRHPDETVQILKPKFGDWGAIPVLTKSNQFIGVARPDRKYGFTEQAGAVEASRRQALDRKVIMDLKSQTQRISVTSLMVEHAKREEPLPEPETSAVVRLTDEMAEIGRQVAQTPQAQASAKRNDAKRAHLKRLQQLGLDKKGAI